MAKPWQIIIKPPITGFAPAFWENSYPAYGSKEQAGDMQNIDLFDPSVIKQGAGLETLTKGSEVDNVTTLIKHIMKIPLTSNVTYGIGGNKLYKISSTEVLTEVGPPLWPHTIDKATVTGELGESVCPYGSNILYFYNHSGAAGDIGKFNGTSFDDDWGSTVPATGAAVLQNAPHPSELGGDGIVYFGNGQYVGFYDPITDVLSVDELDLPAGSQVVDLKWNNGNLFIAVNYPNLSGNNANVGMVYVWDTISVSWSTTPNPKIAGTIGAIFIKDGTPFVFYQDLSSTGGLKLGYVSGNSITELVNFTGSLPNFGQVCEYKNMIAWVSAGEVWVFGSSSKGLPATLCQFADGGYATVGALSVPFGTPLVASTETTFFKLAKFSGYDVNSFFKSIMFDVGISMVDKIEVYFEPLSTGARCDVTLRYNRGASSFLLEKSGEIMVGRPTADNSTDYFTLTSHGLVNGQKVTFRSGTMPVGITDGVEYFVINKTAHTFQVSLTSGGPAELFTSNGSDFVCSRVETGSISFIDDSSRTRKNFNCGIECEDFRIELDYANSSTTNTVKIRKILINGHFLDKE